MASGTFTLTADELTQYTDYVKTVRRMPEWRQLVNLMQRLGQKYGISSNDGVNALCPRTVNGSTGVVTWNTADVALEHQF